MKLAPALAAILGLTLAPAAYAQVSCSEVSRINTEALDDFDDISGDEIDDDLYEATYELGGADECNIDYAWDSIYSCGYQYASYASASAAWSSRLAEISSCLSGWTPSNVTPESTATDGYRTLSGTLYEGSGAYADLEWAVVLEEHTDTSGLHYHVWVELAYYW